MYTHEYSYFAMEYMYLSHLPVVMERPYHMYHTYHAYHKQLTSVRRTYLFAVG